MKLSGASFSHLKDKEISKRREISAIGLEYCSVFGDEFDLNIQ